VPLRKLLLGEKVLRFDVYIKLLRIFTQKITEEIVINEGLLGPLVARGALLPDEKEEILDHVDRGHRGDGRFLSL
jgi:hypothetical protein